MKVIIEVNEWYPVFELDANYPPKGEPSYFPISTVNVSARLYRRYEKALNEWYRVQKILSKLDDKKVLEDKGGNVQ